MIATAFQDAVRDGVAGDAEALLLVEEEARRANERGLRAAGASDEGSRAALLEETIAPFDAQLRKVATFS